MSFCACGNAGTEVWAEGSCRPCWIQRWYPDAVPPVQRGPFVSTLPVAQQHDTIRRAKNPCIHRSAEPTRFVSGCGKCPVYGCAQHGECYRSANGFGLRSCLDCTDYATDRPTWPIRFDHTNLAPKHPGKRFNSSIIDYEGAYLLAYRTWWKGSEVCTIRLDRNFRPVGDPVMADMRQEIDRRMGWRLPGCGFGREDPRLFYHRGQLHVAFIGVQGRAGGIQTHQCFARLKADRTVDDAWKVEIPDRRYSEKNWQFLDYDGDLYAVYLAHPFHRVAKIECGNARIVYEEPNPLLWDGGEIRGGAAPVLQGDEWWSFFHDRVDIAGVASWRVGLYTFDAKPPFAPRRIVREPLMVPDTRTKPANVACCLFPCGAVRSGADWVVSMGVHDRWTELHKFDHAELDRRLLPAEPPRMPAEVRVSAGLVSVTIGIGDKFRDLAQESAASVRRFYGVEHSIILDERHLEACPPRHLFKDSPRQIFWLKWMVTKFFPNIERWIYHDADYRVIRAPDAATLESFRAEHGLMGVRDWWEDAPGPLYLNAGFFIANRSHDPLFDWCRENYWKTPEKWGDQCVWNAGINALSVPVLELPRSFNVGKPEQCPAESVIAAHGYWLDSIPATL